MSNLVLKKDQGHLRLIDPIQQIEVIPQTQEFLQLERCYQAMINAPNPQETQLAQAVFNRVEKLVLERENSLLHQQYQERIKEAKSHIADHKHDKDQLVGVIHKLIDKQPDKQVVETVVYRDWDANIMMGLVLAFAFCFASTAIAIALSKSMEYQRNSYEHSTIRPVASTPAARTTISST